MCRITAKRARRDGQRTRRVVHWGIPAVIWLALGGSPATAELTMQPGMDMMPIPETPRFVPDEVIVKFKAPIAGVSALGAELEPMMALPDAERLTSGGEQILKLIDAQGVGIFEAGSREADRVMDAVKRLNERDDVEYAQPNWIWQHFEMTPDDPRYPEQWHYFTQGSGAGQAPGGIGLPEFWAEKTTGDPDVTVAVIDTGILPDHADISGSPNLAPGYDMISMPFIANDGDGRDNDPTDPGDAVKQGECGQGYPPRDYPDSWHGTHVAGTIGVVKTNNGEGVAGINWQVRLVPVRVLGKCGGTTSDINDAIRWAAGLSVPGVPDNPHPAKVINMSLGGEAECSSSPATQAAIDDAVAAGATVVVAAGNSGKDASGFTPAGCDGTITVAGSDYRGHLTPYSNYGDAVEIMAPGGDRSRDDNGDGAGDGVLSTVKDGYALYNGTSMAAPHVAGVAALLLAENEDLTPEQVLQRLQASALPRSSTECPKPCGAGLLSTSEPDPTKVVLSVDTPTANLKTEETKNIVVTVTVGGAPKADVPVAFVSQDTAVVTVTPASANTNAQGRVAANLSATDVGGPVCVDVSTDGQTVCIEVTVAKPLPGISLWGLAGLVAFMLGWTGFRKRSVELGNAGV